MEFRRVLFRSIGVVFPAASLSPNLDSAPAAFGKLDPERPAPHGRKEESGRIARAAPETRHKGATEVWTRFFTPATKSPSMGLAEPLQGELALSSPFVDAEEGASTESFYNHYKPTSAQKTP